MRQHTIGQVAIKRPRSGGDLRPIFLRAVFHRCELRTVGGMFGHGRNLNIVGRSMSAGRPPFNDVTFFPRIRGLGAMRKSLEDIFKGLLFASRWFMAPFYAGLALALLVLMIVFGKEVLAETMNLGHLEETAVVVWVLSLIDMSLAANLT